MLDFAGIEIKDKWETHFARGYDVSYVLDVFGRPMEVVYLMDRSEPEKGDHPYFRKKDAANSDITLFHDSFIYDPETVNAVYFATVNRAKTIIFEDVARVFRGYAKPEVYDSLPGETILSPGRFGCARSGFNGVVTYFPDPAEVSEIAEDVERSKKLKSRIEGLYSGIVKMHWES